MRLTFFLLALLCATVVLGLARKEPRSGAKCSPTRKPWGGSEKPCSPSGVKEVVKQPLLFFLQGDYSRPPGSL